MKIICAPDSFKGSLSSPEAAAAMQRGILRACPDAEIVCLPIADGGEGTLDALLTATDGTRLTQTVRGPLGGPHTASYGMLGQGSHTAVVEMASAAGLGLVPAAQRDPRRTSTYGVGELLASAMQSGATRIIVGLGGSATNDAGAGAMQALGVRLLGNNGKVMADGIGGGDLIHVASIDMQGLRRVSEDMTMVLASDVTNPLLGPNGASATYGPQKGATPAMVSEMEDALSHFTFVLERDTGVSIATRAGGGAAGGLGAALMAVYGAQMQSGIELVLDAAGFNAHIQDADYVFTGEGKIDAQTLHGKAIAGVLTRCNLIGKVPVIAFGGAVDSSAASALAARGMRSAFSIVSGPTTLEDAMQQGAGLLEEAAERVTRLLIK